MKLSQLKVEILDEATAAALQTAVNAFLAAGVERTMVGEPPIQFLHDGTNYVAFITYIE